MSVAAAAVGVLPVADRALPAAATAAAFPRPSDGLQGWSKAGVHPGTRARFRGPRGPENSNHKMGTLETSPYPDWVLQGDMADGLAHVSERNDHEHKFGTGHRGRNAS